MRWLRSLSLRLALAHAAIFIASAAVIGGTYYWANVVRPMEVLRSQVGREAQLFSQIYVVDGTEAARAALVRRSLRSGPRRPFHALLRADGTAVTANLPSWPARRSKEWMLLEADIYLDGDENDYSPLIRDIRFRDGSRLLIGRDAEDIEEIEETLASGIPWALAAVVLLGLLGGLMMSRVLGARIEAINNAARQVMAGDLSGRIAVRGSGDDFDGLAETLNAMLQRNEELFEAIRRVSDNVAHELRTPLTRLQFTMEKLIQTPLSDAERDDLTRTAIGEVERLRKIFDSLLRISRLEGRRYAVNAAIVDARQLAQDVADLYEPMAARRNIQLKVCAPHGLTMEADADLLMQALANLLDNALKFSPDNGAIALNVEKGSGTTRFIVDDTGPGIADTDLERATERFFRGSAAQGVQGEGLGLSLVSAIAALHGGKLTFRNRNPGLRAVIEIPDRPGA